MEMLKVQHMLQQKKQERKYMKPFLKTSKQEI